LSRLPGDGILPYRSSDGFLDVRLTMNPGYVEDRLERLVSKNRYSRSDVFVRSVRGVGVLAQTLSVIKALATDATFVVMQRNVLSNASRTRERFVAGGTGMCHSNNN
jgi:hypothetical protein